jgi:5-methylcytosine-specific restriction endonuclease McrA
MNKVYNWKEIDEYARTHTVKECRARFGFCSQAWTDAVKRGDVRPRDKKTPLAKIAVENSLYSRCHLKKRIIDENLISYICTSCGNTGEWLGKKLVLELEHKNGVSNDHRLNNLQFLCPNCHSQTETFSGRNNRK